MLNSFERSMISGILLDIPSAIFKNGIIYFFKDLSKINFHYLQSFEEWEKLHLIYLFLNKDDDAYWSVDWLILYNNHNSNKKAVCQMIPGDVPIMWG